MPRRLGGTKPRRLGEEWYRREGYSREEIEAMQVATARVQNIPEVYIRPTQAMPLDPHERVQVRNLLSEERWYDDK